MKKMFVLLLGAFGIAGLLFVNSAAASDSSTNKSAVIFTIDPSLVKTDAPVTWDTIKKQITCSKITRCEPGSPGPDNLNNDHHTCTVAKCIFPASLTSGIDPQQGDTPGQFKATTKTPEYGRTFYFENNDFKNMQYPPTGDTAFEAITSPINLQMSDDASHLVLTVKVHSKTQIPDSEKPMSGETGSASSTTSFQYEYNTAPTDFNVHHCALLPKTIFSVTSVLCCTDPISIDSTTNLYHCNAAQTGESL